MRPQALANAARAAGVSGAVTAQTGAAALKKVSGVQVLQDVSQKYVPKMS